MRAVTWHGRADVRVDTVPDPVIQEPTDVIIEVTSTGICGSDLHLIEVMAPFMTVGDVMGHEPMGIVREVGSEVTAVRPATASSSRSTSPAAPAGCATQGLQSQCETTQNRDQGFGASLFGYTKLYGQVPGGQAEYLRVPFGNTLPIKVPEGPPDDRFVYLSDVLPTAWQAVQYAGIPQGGSVLVLGLGPIGDMCTRIAQHLGAGQVFGVDVVPERLARARARGVDGHRHHRAGRRRRRVRDATDGRGPDAVIDAVGMEAHGSPLATLAQKATARRARRDHGEGHAGGRRRPAGRAEHRDRGRPPRRHDLAVGRLRRRDRPAAADAHVRQADPAAHGPGQRAGAGCPTSCRCSPTPTPSASTTSPPTTCRSRRRPRRT